LLLLALVIAARAEGEWKTVDLGFVLSVPPDWEQVKERGIDSYVGRLKSKDAELTFDEAGSFMYSAGEARLAVANLKRKARNPKLLKVGEEIWIVDGRVADFSIRKPDFAYGVPPFTNVATLFVPYKGSGGSLSIAIFYRSKDGELTARRILQSVVWKKAPK